MGFEVENFDAIFKPIQVTVSIYQTFWFQNFKQIWKR